MTNTSHDDDDTIMACCHGPKATHKMNLASVGCLTPSQLGNVKHPEPI